MQIKKILLKLILFLPVLLFITRVFADQDITVTGTVPPSASDFQLSINQSPNTTQPQYQNITYTINYGSNLYYADHITVEAQWYQGTINGNSNPSVDGMDYVLNSASSGYNSTSPTIDLVNNKIDWSISSFPSQTTNQTVSFKLSTNDTYQGSQTVSYPINVRIIATGFTTSDQSVTTIYQYDALITPTPSSTPTLTPTPTPARGGLRLSPFPTSTPTPTLTPSPTPTSSPSTNTTTPNPTAIPTVIPTPTVILTPTLTTIPSPTPLPKQVTNAFTNFAVNSISSSNITLAIQTTLPSTMQALYGTDPNNLNQSVNNSSFLLSQNMSFSNLASNTNYYFKFIGKGTDASDITSDILNFKTAQISSIANPVVALNTLTFSTSNNVISTPSNAKLNNNLSAQQNSQVIVLPQKTLYSFKFSLTNHKKIKKLIVFVKNLSVLGMSNILGAEDETNTYSLELTSKNNSYQGNLKIPDTPGVYEIYAQISDYDGNITLQKIATIIVGGPITIFDNSNKQPIYHAKIYFYFLNTKTNKYELFTKSNFPISNPSFTNLNGVVKLALREGKYKLVVSAPGYINQNVNFSISSSIHSGYPQIYLKRQPLSLSNFLIFLKNDLSPIYANLLFYLSLPQIINNIFLINSFLIGIIFIFLFIKFLNRSVIFIFQKEDENRIIKGIVMNQNTNKPLSNLKVILFDHKTKKIVEETKTNIHGRFYFGKFITKTYQLQIQDKKFNLNNKTDSIFRINYEVAELNFEENIELVLKKIFKIVFLLLLLITLIIEIWLGFTLSWKQVWIFIVLDLLNFLSLWTVGDSNS